MDPLVSGFWGVFFGTAGLTLTGALLMYARTRRKVPLRMALSLWSRYSYLIELREVMAHGPSYDPVTRMRSHAETGELVGALFNPSARDNKPVGVIAVSIGNLYALEQLHGRFAVNHALFGCARACATSRASAISCAGLSESRASSRKPSSPSRPIST